MQPKYSISQLLLLCCRTRRHSKRDRSPYRTVRTGGEVKQGLKKRFFLRPYRYRTVTVRTVHRRLPFPCRFNILSRELLSSHHLLCLPECSLIVNAHCMHNLLSLPEFGGPHLKGAICSILCTQYQPLSHKAQQLRQCKCTMHRILST